MPEHFIAGGATNLDPNSHVVILRCPRCRKNGTFEAIGSQDLRIHNLEGHEPFVVGERRCPDPTCRSLVFFAWPDGAPESEITSFPPETIDFDASDLPPDVISALTEAVTCLAHGCFKASAMMVRKCLEELCADRKAKGGNLKDRIKALGKQALMPGELFDGLDDLRLLGNDAAHVESRDYDEIGKEEVEVGIAFTKEVLKATYQYAGLRAKLSALKKERAEAE